MRAKIQHMLEFGTTPPPAMDEDFLPLLEFPGRVGGDEEVGRRCVVGAGVGAGGRRVSSRCMALAAEVRAMVRGAPGRKVFLERGRGVGGGDGGGGREGGGERGGEKRVKWEDEVGVGGEEEMGESGEEEGEGEGEGDEEDHDEAGEDENEDENDNENENGVGGDVDMTGV